MHLPSDFTNLVHVSNLPVYGAKEASAFPMNSVDFGHYTKNKENPD
jgi:hypothetical protein